MSTSNDQECFKWPIKSALYTPAEDLRRVSNYKNINLEIEEALKDIPFPI